MKPILVLLFIFFIAFNTAFVQESDFPILEEAYFGKEAPTEYAEVFMDGIISKLNEAEMCAGFTDNGTCFYYNAQHNGAWTIFETKIQNKKWTKPQPVNFTNGYTDRDFTISPDGNKIYFGSNRPRVKGQKKQKSLDIYVSVKNDSGIWNEPQNMGNVINTNYSENYPAIDANGNLYFFSNRGEGQGGCEIYLSRFINGGYLEPELLSSAINSNKHDWDSFIAPDGSYIIFSSQNRDDTIGLQDLYISFKDKNGKWIDAINMGPKVNSTKDEICPSVSTDGNYFFFTSRRRGLADIYWINAEIIETLKPKELCR